MSDLDDAICDFDEEVFAGDSPDEDREFGCAFPDECCMPGLHYPSECHTAQMMEDVNAEYEELDPELLDAINNHGQGTGEG